MSLVLDQTETAVPHKFQITPESQLRRYLIMGSTSSQVRLGMGQDLTSENMKNVLDLARSNGDMAISLAVDYSVAGRITKNDTALLVLAAVLTVGDDRQKRRVSLELPKVARTGTHILTFVSMVEQLRGWGKAAKRAVGSWYLNFETSQNLAYQLIKYANRSGWTHQDVLRICHVNPSRLSASHQAVLRWAARGMDGLNKEQKEVLPAVVQVVEDIHSKSLEEVVKLVESYSLPHEVVPNDFKRDTRIWEALLPSMGITALTRNLARFSNLGMMDNSEVKNHILAQLGSRETLRRGRVHPLTLLNALYTYQSGRGVRGSMQWAVDSDVSQALEAAFYASFDLVEPTGKRFMLGVDVSGSMASRINQESFLTHADVAAVMAMLTVKTEPNSMVLGFSEKIKDLGIESTDTLSQVRRKTYDQNFGRTNCGALMGFARRMKLPVDVFSIYTDNDSNTGESPKVALAQYREELGVDSKLISVATLSSYSSIADPSDPGMIDLVGFDTSLPTLIREFAEG